ncbi:tRNA pseudouridine(55) synthase TruB [Sulfurovum sp. NBC37-1]|uniref:tRNA pseudouridine synthase B n=1 Tax=Sulfurovum sp. (strain NBC37-1) TaxID=387093 RepID=TRUB_SULNB|nr:tRNA pseudouridine(55) synthase TruB [Sulfurovum sp. NBC37-1]A6Q784.1 RecName: Full=tRNA pseudouridine synthase B; AltName: Full=tRNA pseudouridine(55) synthase; Short=Psi55 synthase; AltName: Full=tRNA pseudouridylate synthase; AltName: Full=tRNA-uridine isomerase [Sulfurovum sp. NBC37-1]BAF71343.1 tRNA pseudouridine synthase B [Sulfurovum sp. NBC37-1]
MNRLFVVNKPIFRTSNGYMGYVKRKYNTKKVGFSGTLDPFATGCLIVATGQYTKLFQYLNKTPKSYKATLWLGANSPSLDIEKVDSIREVAPFSQKTIEEVLQSFKGELTYYPPRFSAKKVNGKRAYELAREGKEIDLKQITSTIYEITLINYNHPFIHFEATVSEGTYIRSLGALIADRLRVDATLSSLHRIHEGQFHYENEKALDPFTHLAIPSNIYTGDEAYLELGKKLSVDYFEAKENGIYLIETSNFFSIIEIVGEAVKYRFNRIPKFEDTP